MKVAKNITTPLFLVALLLAGGLIVNFFHSESVAEQFLSSSSSSGNSLERERWGILSNNEAGKNIEGPFPPLVMWNRGECARSCTALGQHCTAFQHMNGTCKMFRYFHSKETLQKISSAILKGAVTHIKMQRPIATEALASFELFMRMDSVGSNLVSPFHAPVETCAALCNDMHRCSGFLTVFNDDSQKELEPVCVLKAKISLQSVRSRCNINVFRKRAKGREQSISLPLYLIWSSLETVEERLLPQLATTLKNERVVAFFAEGENEAVLRAVLRSSVSHRVVDTISSVGSNLVNLVFLPMNSNGEKKVLIAKWLLTHVPHEPLYMFVDGDVFFLQNNYAKVLQIWFPNCAIDPQCYFAFDAQDSSTALGGWGGILLGNAALAKLGERVNSEECSKCSQLQTHTTTLECCFQLANVSQTHTQLFMWDPNSRDRCGPPPIMAHVAKRNAQVYDGLQEALETAVGSQMCFIPLKVSRSSNCVVSSADFSRHLMMIPREAVVSFYNEIKYGVIFFD